MISKFYLKDNPFRRQKVTDVTDFEAQPFVPTHTIELKRKEIEWAFTSDDPDLFYNFVGTKGTGKTSALLYLKNFIEKSKLNGDKMGIVFINQDFDKIRDDDISLHHFIYGTPISNIVVAKKEVRKFLDSYKHVYFFFDVSEIVTKPALTNLAKFLDYIIRNHYGSVFIAMNDEHFRILQKITTIVGYGAKITTINLNDDFNFEFLCEVTQKRLEKARVDGYGGDSLYPFSADALVEIARISSFIPRNFLVGCYNCLNRISDLNKNIIDFELVTYVMKQDFVDSILIEREKNNSEREVLKAIVDTIKTSFDGVAPTIPKLFTKLITLNKYPLSYPTLIARIKKLEEYGIVKQERNFTTTRSNYVKLIV